MLFVPGVKQEPTLAHGQQDCPLWAHSAIDSVLCSDECAELYIDIEAFGFIVDVAEDHSAVSVEFGGIQPQVQFIMNQFYHFHSQDCCT